MFVPGIWLIALGGSWYYSLAGAGLAAAGFYYWKKQLLGAWIFGAVFAGTALWAVWEVGFELWPLVPRLVAPMVLAILAVLLVPSLNEGRGRTASLAAAGVLALGIAGFFWGMATPQNVIANTDPVPTRAIAAESPNWTHYGRTPTGTRFAPFDQITPENVGELEVAWTFNHGDAPSGTGQDQNTPLYVDGLVYHCSPNNIVSAIDAVTGAQVWQYDPEASSPLWQRCRGVTYYEPTPREGAPADGTCAARIVLSSVDARLIQLDARTGALCTTFGDGGAVDLTRNMGEVRPGFYFPTSAPTVMGDRIILGGWVWDGMAVDEPSGVVRAFDGRTGEIAWAWDIGNPAIDTVPPEGETYTRGTPNVWSTPAFDAALGLVYLPTGNAQPDFYGSSRIEAANDWNSSIVALDVETGKVVWSFQTTYRDIWDYDVPAQPMLYDITTETGEVVPALIQVTKRSQTFVLDRRDGTPIAEVRDLPVPTTGGVEPDYLSPVQPYSVDMPVIGAEPLTEARMWGATPLDHLYCRIRFRQAYYVGDFTPMSEQGTLIWPGYFGGMNWGTGTIDEARGLLIVNDTRVAHLLQLIPRQEADALGVEVVGPWDPLGMRGTVSRTLLFKDVFVSEDESLMPRGVYYQAASRWPHMFMTLSPTYMGIAQAAFDFTVKYLRGEWPGLPPVKRRMFPTKQMGVAQMHLMLEQTKALWFQAITEAGPDPSREQMLRAWAAHYTVMENANEICQLAIRTCGGQSMLKSLPLERLFRDSRCGALMLPWTAEICLDRIGRESLYLPGETDE
jgi:quinate dehydrogenase (quinone)